MLTSPATMLLALVMAVAAEGDVGHDLTFPHDLRTVGRSQSPRCNVDDLQLGRRICQRQACSRPTIVGTLAPDVTMHLPSEYVVFLTTFTVCGWLVRQYVR